MKDTRMVGYLFTHHQNGDKLGTSLVVQWLGFCAFTTEGLRSIPGQETKYLQAARHSQKKKKMCVKGKFKNNPMAENGEEEDYS